MQKTLLSANRTKTMIQKKEPQKSLKQQQEARRKQLIEELQKQKTAKLELNKPLPFTKQLDYGENEKDKA